MKEDMIWYNDINWFDIILWLDSCPSAASPFFTNSSPCRHLGICKLLLEPQEWGQGVHLNRGFSKPEHIYFLQVLHCGLVEVTPESFERLSLTETLLKNIEEHSVMSTMSSHVECQCGRCQPATHLLRHQIVAFDAQWDCSRCLTKANEASSYSKWVLS